MYVYIYFIKKSIKNIFFNCLNINESSIKKINLFPTPFVMQDMENPPQLG